MALALASLAAACQIPSSSALEPRSEAPRPSPAPLALPDFVDVRLAAYERAERVRVGGLSGGSFEFWRERDEVACSDGRRGRALELDAESVGGELALAERSYGGSLLVEAHPAGGLSLTLRLPLEEYVAGVVAGELVLWSAQPAELEAQAIAARTYALRALAERGGPRARAFVWDDTRDQVLRGRFQPASTARGAEVKARLERALRASAGRVLERDGQLFDARFHASCGGSTAAYADVFPSAAGPGSTPVPCAPCRGLAAADAPGGAGAKVRWEWTASEAALARLAGSLGIGRSLRSLRPARVDDHGRWLVVELEGELGRRRLDFVELRRRLGQADLKSARILRTWPPPGESLRGGLYFEGLGRGHGVGLCQVGARELAAQGWSSTLILEHYYPGARVRRLGAGRERVLAQLE